MCPSSGIRIAVAILAAEGRSSAWVTSFWFLCPARVIPQPATHSRPHPVLSSPLARRSLMDEITINEYARQLLEAHGDRAVAEAAQRAIASEQRNDEEEAKTWRHIEAALKVMRGPLAS